MSVFAHEQMDFNDCAMPFSSKWDYWDSVAASWRVHVPSYRAGLDAAYPQRFAHLPASSGARLDDRRKDWRRGHSVWGDAW